MTRDPHRARRAMLFIQRHIATKGEPPTVRELGAGIGLNSTSAVVRVLEDLEASGHIARTANGHRAISVIRPMADDRFEEAAIAVCEALGIDAAESIAKARQAIVSTLVKESQAA